MWPLSGKDNETRQPPRCIVRDPVFTSEHYEIASLIVDRCREMGLRKSDVARRAGYSNAGKGLRRLDQLLKGDLERTVDLINALPSILEISSDVVQGKVEETQHQLANELEIARHMRDAAWRSAFRPHCVIIAERIIPQPIFVAAIIGVERILRLDFDRLSTHDTFVQQSIDGIRKRLLEFNSSSKSPKFLPGFGKPIGFFVNYTPDCAIRYNLIGEPLEFSSAKRLGAARFEFS